MTPAALVFFLLFGVILVATYIGIRRRLLPPTAVATFGVVGSVGALILFSLAQGNHIVQAIIVGLLVGGLFSGGILAMAWYFETNAKK